MKKYLEFLNKETSASELITYLRNSNIPIAPPIDIEKILKFLELSYNSKPDFRQMQITGSIKVDNNEPLIWANPFQNKFQERKRFTLAHELGHFMLHIAPKGNSDNFTPFTDPTITFNRDDNWDYQEMEANSFAAQLLMPSNLIFEEIKLLTHSQPAFTKDQVIDFLAEKFHVSSQAMEYRLKKLGASV